MGIFDKVKSAAKGAYDAKMADMKERVSNPEAWETKQSDKRMVKMQRQNKELAMNAKNARLEASIARSQASRRRYEPNDGGFGMGGGFGGIDLGGNGGGSGGFDMSGGGMGGFDMNGGGGFGGIDLGMGTSKKHKRPNKKAKKGKKGDIHITIHK